MPDIEEQIYVGDWVQFIQNNRIVTSEVRYIQEETSATYAVTDDGQVNVESILQIRHVQPNSDLVGPIKDHLIYSLGEVNFKRDELTPEEQTIFQCQEIVDRIAKWCGHVE